jgi:hypothetical protein
MNTVQLLLKSLFALASMVEARDPYTGGHLWRVSQFSRRLAEDAGLPASDVARIMVGGFLHDLGKIAVPDAILNKPDRLSDTEYAVIMTHPDVGHRLLSDHPLADLALAAVHAHHERPDGAGYPRRLVSADIPLDARIVGITDAFDAMTSTRPYRKGMPILKALTIIEENLGSQFDSEWGRRFIALGSCGELEHIVGHSEPGIPLQECPACGPIVVINRRHQEGSLVYCRHCSGELKVSGSGPDLALTPTGQRGQPAELEPSVDHELFAELVNLAEACLAQTN